jgi:hypothetical protein
MVQSFGDKLVKDAMRHGNGKLLLRSLIYRDSGIYNPTSAVVPIHSTISHSDECFLYKHGHPNILGILINKGLIELDRCGNHGTFWFDCLGRSEVRMARALLRQGLKINRRWQLVQHDEVDLYHAAYNAHTTDLMLLLENGADLIDNPGAKFPLPALRRRLHSRRCFILDMARKHGKEYLEREDIWDLYEEPKP